jgi:hypothetical protein
MELGPMEHGLMEQPGLTEQEVKMELGVMQLGEMELRVMQLGLTELPGTMEQEAKTVQ